VFVAADVLALGGGTAGLLDRSRCPARSDFASDHWKPISRSGSEAGRPPTLRSEVGRGSHRQAQESRVAVERIVLPRECILRQAFVGWDPIVTGA
jgi:hypothetical protein